MNAKRMSVEEAIDRLEIAQLFVEYSEAIDNREWDRLDYVFTVDAVIDYTEMGGIRGGLEAIKQFLSDSMGHRSGKLGFMHMNGQSRVAVAGDRASARTPCFNPMILELPEGQGGAQPAEHVYFCGHWYEDELVRTSDGWRIQHRHETRAYKYNRPDWAGAPRD